MILGPPASNAALSRVAPFLSGLTERSIYLRPIPGTNCYGRPLDPGLADYSRFSATGSPYTDSANWYGMSAGDKEIVRRILVNYGKAIEAYLRKLVSRNAPFDRYLAGDPDAISLPPGQAGGSSFLLERLAASGAITHHCFPMTISISSVDTLIPVSPRMPIRPKRDAAPTKP